MKKFKVFLIMCFCVTLVFSLSGCGKDKNQVALYKDLDSSLEKYFDYKEGSTFEEEKKNQIKRVSEQIKVLKKYQSMKFEDRDIKGILNNYVKALESRKEGFEKYYATTNNKKNQEYTIEKGKKKMGESINKLIDNHGYKPTKELKKKIDDYFNTNFRFFDPGEKVKIKTNYGDYYFTIDNIKDKNIYEYEFNEKENSKKRLKYSNLFGEIELINYKDPYVEENFINLSKSINLINKNNYTLNFDSGYSEEGYAWAIDGNLVLGNARKLKTTIPFYHDIDDSILLLEITNDDGEMMESFIKINN